MQVSELGKAGSIRRQLIIANSMVTTPDGINKQVWEILCLAFSALIAAWKLAYKRACTQ